MLVTHAPVRMVQWGPDDELNELESIEDRFADLAPAILHGAAYHDAVRDEAFREFIVRRSLGYHGDAVQDWLRAEERARASFLITNIASVRTTASSATTFHDQLSALLGMWSNPQTLYVSCHGTPDALARDRAGRTTYSFADFGKALTHLPSDCVSLVLGACHALSPTSPMLEHLPAQISSVYGFTGTPAAVDVASLMLGVLHEDTQLFSDLSNENSRCTAGGVPLDQFERLLMDIQAAFAARIDAHQDHPARHVRGDGGVSIRALRRVEYEEGRSCWQGSTIPLRDTPS